MGYEPISSSEKLMYDGIIFPLTAGIITNCSGCSLSFARPHVRGIFYYVIKLFPNRIIYHLFILVVDIISHGSIKYENHPVTK